MGDFLFFERYTWFHRKVKDGKYPNATTLARKFEISRKTAQRQIERMKLDLLAPLEYDPVRKGYRYEDESFELPHI